MTTIETNPTRSNAAPATASEALASAARTAAPNARQHASPPVTLEGWYACHQIFTVDRRALRGMNSEVRSAAAAEFEALMSSLESPAVGWSRLVLLSGSVADLMVIHFRPTIDELGTAQRALAASLVCDAFDATEVHLSVAEAGMYSVVAELTRRARERNGTVGDDEFNAELASRLETERTSAHTMRRLYPPPPGDDMPYVCYYPMSKRRAPTQNWYELPAEDRGRLMWEHGKSGRRHAGRIQQIVSGSIGLDLWEWGVTLFGRDPLDFKKAVTDMRFDEASARYADFGDFYVGRVASAAECLAAFRIG